MFGLRPIATALVVFSLSCADEIIFVENAPPEIEILETCYEDGLPMIRIKLTDQEMDAVDLSIRRGASMDAPWLFPGARGVGLVGLATASNGRTHSIHWGPCPEMSGPCALPSAVTALEPGFVAACSCAEPPSDTPFPADTLVFVAADASGETRLTMSDEVFSEAPCGP